MSSTTSTPPGEPPTQGAAATQSRRSHPKSRTGCRTCKNRKIKCDEQKPSCRNCIKHGVSCDFLAGITGGDVSTSSPRPSGTGLLPELNMLDLELLHNFSTSTYSTLASDPAIQTFYRINVVQMGLRCDYLMRSILSISALHLAHYRLERREFYVTQALLYHQLASRAATNLMGDPDKENGEHLYMFSVLTVYFALASPRRPEDLLLVGESSFPDWILLSQASRTLTPLLGENPETGNLGPLFIHGRRRWMVMYLPSQSRHDHNVDMDVDSHSNISLPPGELPRPEAVTQGFIGPTVPVGASAQAQLTEMLHQINETVSDEELKAIYIKSIEELRPSMALFFPTPSPLPAPQAPSRSSDLSSSPLYSGTSSAHASVPSPLAGSAYPAAGLEPNPPPLLPPTPVAPVLAPLPHGVDITDAFMWIYTVAEDLLPLLRGSGLKQEAVAIFAHFCVMLRRLEGQWWLQGWGDHLLRWAWSVLDQEHRLWIRWCLEVVGFAGV